MKLTWAAARNVHNEIQSSDTTDLLYCFTVRCKLNQELSAVLVYCKECMQYKVVLLSFSHHFHTRDRLSFEWTDHKRLTRTCHFRKGDLERAPVNFSYSSLRWCSLLFKSNLKQKSLWGCCRRELVIFGGNLPSGLVCRFCLYCRPAQPVKKKHKNN